MTSSRRARVTFGLATAGRAGASRAGRQQGQGQLPSSASRCRSGLRERGSSVTPAFEGWYHNKDGSVSLLVGYFNRNTKQELDIPVGPNNRIEPGGPDMGQPTHFPAGRQWGVFSIKLPKDFGDKKLTWTLVANGFSNTITLHTKPDYILEPYEDPANKNTPPVAQLRAERCAVSRDRRPGIAATYTATAGEPLTLTPGRRTNGAKLNLPALRPAPASRRSPRRRCRRSSGVCSADRRAVTFDPFNPRPDPRRTARTRRRRRSPRPASTSCGCRRTIRRAKAAADSSAAGPTRT